MGVSPYSVIDAVCADILDTDTFARHGNDEELALEALGKFLNVKSEEITLTHNVSEGINIVCWGLQLNAGDEIIISGHEHVGSASPWLNRWKISGVKLVVINLGKTADETMANITRAISSKTKVIALPHIPCTIGQVLPVKEICTLAKQKNIFSMIDGAHPPGMMVIDLKDIGCDFYAGCCHKWMLGPKGTGFLYVAEEKRKDLQAYYGGAGVDTGWDLLSDPQQFKGYADNGHRYYYGTQNTSLYKGIVKAIDFQNEIGRPLIEKRTKDLANYLQQNLMTIKGIEMLTPTEPCSKAAQVSFRIKGNDIQKLYEKYHAQYIITRFVPENNINCLRISCHIYNTYSELDALLEITEQFMLS